MDGASDPAEDCDAQARDADGNLAADFHLEEAESDLEAEEVDQDDDSEISGPHETEGGLAGASDVGESEDEGGDRLRIVMKIIPLFYS